MYRFRSPGQEKSQEEGGEEEEDNFFVILTSCGMMTVRSQPKEPGNRSRRDPPGAVKRASFGRGARECSRREDACEDNLLPRESRDAFEGVLLLEDA
jgi:hypothetical protein